MTDDTNNEDPRGLRVLSSDDAYLCLVNGDIDGFNAAVENRDLIDFSGTNLRGVDLRRADLSKVTIRGAHMKRADLRGLDLSSHDLHGCSINAAQISGVLFPANVPAEEVRMSVELGTRIRTSGTLGRK